MKSDREGKSDTQKRQAYSEIRNANPTKRHWRATADDEKERQSGVNHRQWTKLLGHVNFV